MKLMDGRPPSALPDPGQASGAGPSGGGPPPRPSAVPESRGKLGGRRLTAIIHLPHPPGPSRSRAWVACQCGGLDWGLLGLDGGEWDAGGQGGGGLKRSPSGQRALVAKESAATQRPSRAQNRRAPAPSQRSAAGPGWGK